MKNRTKLRDKIVGWIKLSRLPFHTVGVLPFILGTLVAWKIDGIFVFSVFSIGVTAVILTMLATYQAGEYFDYHEDTISKSIFKSRFAGGSGVIQEGTVSRIVPLKISVAALMAAAGIGLFLQFFLKTGPYTILLGALGLFGGFFYSTKPVRLVDRGIGELVIGFCYGWLPIASAYYIQTGYIHQIIYWVSVPIGMTIFNVILLNEFLDYPGDTAVGKKNLLVRFGKRHGAYLYAAVSFCAWISVVLSLNAGIHYRVLYGYLPIIFLSAFIVGAILKGKYENYQTLEILCGFNIVVNLGTTGSFMLALL
jgi:1,4-dihydroxy-2-naphthoate octaprenyltransferase